MLTRECNRVLFWCWSWLAQSTLLGGCTSRRSMERREYRRPMMTEEELVESFRLDSLSSLIDPVHCLSWEESLLQLIDWTRTPIGQENLADGKTVSLFTSLLKRVHTSYLVGQPSDCSLPAPVSFTSILQLFLKLIRNLCVSDSNKASFLADKGPLVLVPVATALLAVCKTTHDSHQSEASSEVRTFSEPSTSKHAGDASSLSEKRAELDAIGRSSSVDVQPSTSQRASYTGDIPASACVECLRMLLQLLGNLSRGGDACQVAVWQEFFPTLFLELASLRLKPVSEVLCMILCTCCQGSKERSWQLCQGQGVGLMCLLVVSAVNDKDFRDDEQMDWFEALWRHLCLEENLFPLLFTNLGIIYRRQVLDFSKDDTEECHCACQIWLMTCTFTSVQVSLLAFIVESLTDDVTSTSYISGNEKSNLKPFLSKDALFFMVKILERAAECVQEESDIVTTAAPLPPWDSAASSSNHILAYVLLLWRVLGMCDLLMEQRYLVTQVLLQHGFLDLLLKMLAALGPPEAPGRKPKVQSNVRDRTVTQPVGVPSTNCYEGYRRDIVAVIANVSHQNRLVQDHVREAGKLILVLQQCTVDEQNPFLREWGLWAMRNLLEGNDLNQKEVASLEMREAVNLPELTDMGLRFELDPNTGGPRLVNTDSQK